MFNSIISFIKSLGISPKTAQPVRNSVPVQSEAQVVERRMIQAREMHLVSIRNIQV